MDDDRSAGNGHGPRVARNGANAVSHHALQLAVDQGVITAAQREELLSLSRADVAKPTAVDADSSGVSFVHVLYWAGALAVLYALGYFLVDRWKSLQPGGVLGVSLLYALSFSMSSMFLARLGFRRASSLFALLAVGMAPIATWAIESLAGIWPTQPARGSTPFTTDVLATIRWIPIELSAALAGLVALRKVRFSVLALSVTVPFAMTVIHLTPLLFDAELDFAIWGWMALLASTILAAAAAEIDRRVSDDQDYAAFVYLTSLVFLSVAVLAVADQSKAIPHSLPALVALLAVLSLLTRRAMFLLFAVVFFIGYLGFLAEDVFKSATGFMLVVVAAGASLILGTVVVQKRFPGLARSFSREAGPRRLVPATRVIFPTAILLAGVLLAFAPSRGRERMRVRMTQLRETAHRSAEFRHTQRAARQAQPPARVGGETPTPARP